MPPSAADPGGGASVRGMARLADIVFDCAHPAALARWWTAALDGYRVAPYDEAELRRLESLGICGPEDDPSVLVEPTSGAGPRIWFQQVPEPKTTKNRVHLDLISDDVDGEVARLLDSGATCLHRDGTRVTLADPAGNEFCIESR